MKKKDVLACWSNAADLLWNYQKISQQLCCWLEPIITLGFVYKYHSICFIRCGSILYMKITTNGRRRKNRHAYWANNMLWRGTIYLFSYFFVSLCIIYMFSFRDECDDDHGLNRKINPESFLNQLLVGRRCGDMHLRAMFATAIRDQMKSRGERTRKTDEWGDHLWAQSAHSFALKWQSTRMI